MTSIEQLAYAALNGDALQLRSLIQDWLTENAPISACSPPANSDLTIRVIAAGLVELLAERRHEPAPTWTQTIGHLDQPLFLVKSALTMPRLRELCFRESPSVLKRRNLFAPPTFLEMA